MFSIDGVINPTHPNWVARIIVEHTNIFMPIHEHYMAHALHQHVIANGKITLYQSEDLRNGLWQCRMIVKGNPGYLRRSIGKIGIAKNQKGFASNSR